MTHKEVTGHHPCLRVAEASLGLSVGLQDPNSRCRFLVERNEPLALRLPRRDAYTWGPIGVAIETIDGQTANFLASGTTPPGDEQSRPLIGAGQRANGWHQPRQLVVGNVPGDTRRYFRKVSRPKERSVRDIMPSPLCHILEEHRQTRKAAPFGQGCERALGASPQHRVHGLSDLHEVLTGHFGERLHLRVRLCEPAHELTQCQLKPDNGAWSISQATGGEIASHDSLHPWLHDWTLVPLMQQPARLLADLSSMREDHMQQMEIGLVLACDLLVAVFG